MAAGSQGEVTYAWFDTGLANSVTGGTLTGSTFSSNAVTNYIYNPNGCRLIEQRKVLVGTTWITKEQAQVTWDADGRMASYTDPGPAGNSDYKAQIAWTYDLAGNVREMKATYYPMDDQGTITGTVATEDDWYRYDSMNRFITVKGTLDSNDDIVRGATGTDITYNLDGTRATATYAVSRTVYVPDGGPGSPPGGGEENGVAGGGGGTDAVGAGPDADAGGGGGGSSGNYVTYTATHEDIYGYTADGYLAGVTFEEGSRGAPDTLPSSGVRAASYTRDAMGRVMDYKEYASDGTSVVYERADTYSSKSEVQTETVTTVTGGDTTVAATHYHYRTLGSGSWDGQYLGGAVTNSGTITTVNGAQQSATSLTNSFTWWDQAETAKIDYEPDTAHDDDVNTSLYHYDALGHLATVNIDDGRPRTVTFVTDADGTILQRDEADANGTGDPRDLYYYFNGIRIGDVSNNGTSDVDYVQSDAVHMAAQGTGPFRYGSASDTPYADFDQSFDPINGLTYDNTSSHYTVQAGDTLQSIAQSVWGDASLWYLIADANGLNGSETLPAGEDLIIPNKVHNVHNTSSVYRVYDPNEAIGNTNPTTPKPQAAPSHHHGGCGVFGEILEIVVAVAVAVALPHIAPAIFGASGVLGGGAVAGAAAAAVGDVAAQGVGIATGIQSGFSFKELALSAIGGGVSGELGKLGVLNGASGFGKVLQGVGRGVLSSVATQGIALATGLQGSFDWAGVAAAGLGEGAGIAAGGGVAGALADEVAAASARSLITGTDFGDNLVAVLPGVIGNTVGGALADELSRGDAPATQVAASLGAPALQVDASGLGDDGVTYGSAPATDPNNPVADATSEGNAATGYAQQAAEQRQSAQSAPDQDDPRIAVPAVLLPGPYNDPNVYTDEDGNVVVTARKSAAQMLGEGFKSYASRLPGVGLAAVQGLGDIFASAYHAAQAVYDVTHLGEPGAWERTAARWNTLGHITPDSLVQPLDHAINDLVLRNDARGIVRMGASFIAGSALGVLGPETSLAGDARHLDRQLRLPLHRRVRRCRSGEVSGAIQ